MASFTLTFVMLLVFWLLLSGIFTPLFIILGVICSLLVARWSHDLLFGDVDIKQSVGMFWRLLKVVPWVLWQIVLANFHLVYLTMHPKMPIDPAFIKFKVDLKTDIGVFILANMITLTPGTVTVRATHNEFIVHAISQTTAEGIISGEMQNKVKEIEGYHV